MSQYEGAGKPARIAAPSIEDILHLVETRLDPKKAVRYHNGDRAALCVTDIFEQVRIGADTVTLHPPAGNKHNAVYGRVSMERQAEDGYSIHDQIARGIHVCAAHGEAFAVYSDAGLGGGLPYDDPQLIRRLAETKAEYYRDAFESILLGPYAPFSEEERASAKAYLEARIAAELKNTDIDEFIDAEQFRSGAYRPALTVAMERLPRIHKFLAGDLTRIARSQYLLADICEKMDRAKVQIVGTIEGLDYLQKKGVGERTLAFVLAIAAEQRLREVRRNSIRGIVAALQAGRPDGVLPHWLVRDGDGKAILRDGGKQAGVLREAVETFLAGQTSLRTIGRRLSDAGVATPQCSPAWSKRALQLIFGNPALAGEHHRFGIAWPILPAVVDRNTFDALQRRLSARKNEFPRFTERPLHLMTDLLKCGICGFALTHRVQTSNKGRIYSCDPSIKGLPPTGHIVTLNAANVETFFEELFFTHADVILGRYRQSKQHDLLRDEIEALRREESAVTSRLETKEAEVRAEAEALAQTIGMTRLDKLVAALRDDRLAALLAEQERVSQEIAERNFRLATLPPPVNLQTIEERLADWQSLTMQQKNTILQTLLKEVRYSDDATDPARGWLTPVTNTAGELSCPPIPINITRYIDGRCWRRLVSVEEYLLSAFDPQEAGK